jgi:hypothetical protein
MHFQHLQHTISFCIQPPFNFQSSKRPYQIHITPSIANSFIVQKTYQILIAIKVTFLCVKK